MSITIAVQVVRTRTSLDGRTRYSHVMRNLEGIVTGAYSTVVVGTDGPSPR